MPAYISWKKIRIFVVIVNSAEYIRHRTVFVKNSDVKMRMRGKSIDSDYFVRRLTKVRMSMGTLFLEPQRLEDSKDI